MRILLVEDEPEMASALRDALAPHNMLLDHAESLAAAFAMIDTYPYDIVLLDRHLPDGDGLVLVEMMREKTLMIPILILTAMGDLIHRVEGLNRGADDYLAKPFAVEELLARVRALVRRPTNLRSDIAIIGKLSYDYINHDAFVEGNKLDLTRREILVLEALMQRFDRMVSRTSLMDSVFSMEDEVMPNALDTQISRLRRKLADSGSGLVINGVRGVGYHLSEEL